MKPETTLKELLIPPFRDGGIGQIICGVNKVHFNETRLIDIRGWGYFQNFENGEQLQDDFCAFVVTALNEKAAREWGARKRWVEYYEGGILFSECPNCKIKRAKNKTAYLYCPICGERLDPPEGSDG